MQRRWLAATVTVLALIALTATGASGIPDPDDPDAGTATESVLDFDDGAIDSAEAQHPGQHGGTEGHLAPVDNNVDVVGKAKVRSVDPGQVADVAVFGEWAYLGAFQTADCQPGGVYVMDTSDLSDPRQEGFIRTGKNSYVSEGVQVINIDTPAFSGDVLAFNNETCVGRQAVLGGASFVDVSDPTNPVFLAEGVGDFDPATPNGIAHQIHSVFMWQDEGKAYAVLVDDEENADVDILDITDPTNPVLIAEYDLELLFPQIVQPDAGLDAIFLHDMVVEEVAGRQVMLASYWDGGYVMLDVEDPTNPRYIADSDFTDPDPELLESAGLTRPPEGNGHQAEFTLNNRYILAADEDFDPYLPEITNVDDDTQIDASQGSDTPLFLPEDSPIEGPAIFVGRACIGDPAVPAGGDGTQIAVVERGLCTFTEKVANVEAAGGYEAILIFNREGPDACNATLGMSVEGSTFTFGVAAREQGLAVFDVPFDEDACLAGDGTAQAPIAVGTVGDTLAIESLFDGWGYVHLLGRTAGELVELDTYAIDEAHDPAFAEGFGDLSVHEVATSARQNDLAYLSYYSGGLRVIRIVGNEIVEAGAFIDEGGNNLWGVQVFERDGVEYVAASDRDFGLYIFQYTP